MQQRRVNVRGIIYIDGKLFCQQLTLGKDGAKRDYWCTPGGGMDLGESLETALRREMIEETGVAPQIGRLLFIQQFSDSNSQRESEQLEFFFHIVNPEDYENIDLSSTTHGELEIANCGFVDPKTDRVLPEFLGEIDIQSYIDEIKPVYLYSDLK